MENIREKFSDFNEAQVYAETIVSMYRKATLLLYVDLVVLTANPVFYQKFGGSRETLRGLRIDGTGSSPGDSSPGCCSRLTFPGCRRSLPYFRPESRAASSWR